MSLPVCLVAAIARNGVIGCDGAMPWRLPTDLRRFKAITMGKPVIMGRRTYESIGAPLPGRLNVVLSRSEFDEEGIVCADSPDQAMKIAREWAGENNAGEICVLGGGEVYRLTMEMADRLYITHVMAEPPGRVKFPPIREMDWKAVSSKFVSREKNDRADMIFVVYERNKAIG